MRKLINRGVWLAFLPLFLVGLQSFDVLSFGKASIVGTALSIVLLVPGYLIVGWFHPQIQPYNEWYLLSVAIDMLLYGCAGALVVRFQRTP